jgi:cellulose synthase/poly-beta-1,6-N-acetylglucosamine synthase-like glycosyltransferase
MAPADPPLGWGAANIARDQATAEARAAAALVAAGMLAPAALARAEADAARWGTGLGETLLAAGVVTSFEWARALAEVTGLPLADLRAAPPDPGLLDLVDRDDYVRLGFMPWRREADGTMVLAATRPFAADTIAWVRRNSPGCPVGFAVTSRFDILWGVQRAFDDVTDIEAREALFSMRPEQSAKVVFTIPHVVALWLILSALLAGLAAAPVATIAAVSGAVSLIYLATFLFRFLLTWVGASRRVDISVSAAEVASLRDEDLPVYTVLVPMYREAEVLPVLVDSIRKLDYPRAKLDVKLVLEAGDSETIEAAKALGTESIFEILRVPHSRPKTKPKACNFALRFARGEYCVIFDAEDMPEPDQLKKAVALFRRSGPELACVQARLNYFNRDDNFLTRMFTLEYSQWFDFLLPGLHRLRVPIPLGGTSNHFRTETLVRLGAWDPYNVTEDADLGVRLTQQGYRTTVVNSTTFEEANGVLRSWISQRSRWIKGYMQTWLVHMRDPVGLWRSLGPIGFLGFQLFIGFPPMTALINPLLWLAFVISLAADPELVAPYFPGWVVYVAMFNLLLGNAMYIYFGVIAAVKRRWYHLVPWGLLAPAYWMLHSAAALKALWQLFLKPHHWEKTQHGTSAATREVLAALAHARRPAPA